MNTKLVKDTLIFYGMFAVILLASVLGMMLSIGQRIKGWIVKPRQKRSLNYYNKRRRHG